MNDVADARSRIAAFAWDYVVILGYLMALLAVGLFFTLGPIGARWSSLMSDPVNADLVAFLVTVLPVALYFAVSEARWGGTWGKRKLRLFVAVAGAGVGVGLGRVLLRNGVKFLPWQMAHTAMFHIPGFPLEPTAAPAWTTVLLSAAWSLLALHLLGLTFLGRRRPLYDRLAGTVVLNKEPEGSGGAREESAPA